MRVREAGPARRVPIRHRGVAVENRDDRRFDPAVRRRPSARLRRQVVLIQPSARVRVVRSAYGDHVLRGRRRPNGPRVAPCVPGGEDDCHVWMGPDECVDHPRLDVVHVRVRTPAVAVDSDRCRRIVVDEPGGAEQIVVILGDVDESLVRADREALEAADVLEIDFRAQRVPIVERSASRRVVVAGER